MTKKEIKYYGFHACLAIWEKRSQDIIRVYLDKSRLKDLKAVLQWCAAQKKAYHVIPTAELDKVSASVHHEGVCFLAYELPFMPWENFLAALPQKPLCLLYLDGVQNPHNLGSILRSCAHFGIPFVLGEEGKLPALSPSACRIAKGGAEIVRLVLLSKAAKMLQKLKEKGFSFTATSSHGGISLYQFNFPPRTILALGSESEGMSKNLLALAENKILIPGTGAIESLNVSIASALCLGEYFRQQQS